MERHIPHVRAGDLITADLFNEVAAQLEKFLNLRVAPNSGLLLETGPFGHSLSLSLPTEIWAKLSGTSSPYSWTQQMPDASGVWSTFGAAAGTNNAYEINGKSGLNGKIVQLAKTSAGDWRFNYIGVGNPLQTFQVKGCAGTGLAGCVISVSSYTCTTGDGTGGTTLGQCSVAIPNGSYTLTITPPSGSGFATYSAPITFSGSTTTTVTLTAASGYVCSCIGNYPVSKTLNFTDGFGTHTLTWVSGYTWSCTYADTTDTVYTGSPTGCSAGTTMTVTYVLTCFSGSYSLSVNWLFVCCGAGGVGVGGHPWYGDDSSTAGTNTSITGACTFSENPFLLTTTLPTSTTDFCPGNQPPGNGLGTPGGGGAVSVTP